MDGWTDGWMDGWIDRRTDKYCLCVNYRKKERNELVDACIKSLILRVKCESNAEIQVLSNL